MLSLITSRGDFYVAIRDGAMLWNDHMNCSGVTFGEAPPKSPPMNWEGSPTIPDNTVWYLRSVRSQFHPEFRPLYGTQQQWEVRAAKVEMLYPYTGPLSGLKKLAAHELGHGFGLWNEDDPCVPGRSIMCSNPVPTDCDREAIAKVYCPIPPSPTPTPTPWPTPTPSNCEVPINHILYPSCGCPPGRTADFLTGCCTCNRSLAFIAGCEVNGGGYDPYLCGCTRVCYDGGSCSPIVVDVLGNGFSLTNPANGVAFDLGATGNQWQTAWTASGSDDAWLALDRNRNGLIDSGKELFGNITVQDVHPSGVERNGFLALAEYDKIMNGGNNDGKINHNDLVFDRLKLWQDLNHDGVSDSCELFTLPQLGLRRIDLDYRQSDRVDAHGNQFKYRSRVYDNQNNQLGRWAWDVFLVVQEP
jgi:hypothetical protein